MGRANHSMVMDRISVHGGSDNRYGWMSNLDVHCVRTGNMGIVIGILIIAVIVWWPRKGDRS